MRLREAGCRLSDTVLALFAAVIYTLPGLVAH